MAEVVSLARRERSWVALVVAALASAVVTAGLQGVDLAAAVYRVDLFHRAGLALWDSQWYGGHWTLDYSVLFPAVAATFGMTLTEVLSAAVAAWTFDRLVTAHYGAQARAGSLLFAVGTLAQVAIGQLPFLLGEALALVALWALSRRLYPVSMALALAASLASPLAGAFLCLAAVACLLSAWPRRRLWYLGIGLAAVLAAAAPALVFRGAGPMPFPALDFAVLLAVFAAGIIAVPASHRSLRLAGMLYVGAIVASFVLPTAVGGNISRLGECVGAPLLTCVLWPQRRRLLLMVALPMLLLQWGPAVGTVVRSAGDPSADSAYFRPVLAFLADHAMPRGRVEGVPTALHWEAAYLAPVIPLARGWERQLDTADNPLFYDGTLTATTYRAWLLNNGVRYVALPDVALDYAATTEGRLLRAGVPGVRQVWQSAHWRIYALSGAPGMLTGRGQITALGPTAVAIHVQAPGKLVLRVRYSEYWTSAVGGACLAVAPGGWIAIDAQTAGDLGLRLHFPSSGNSSCGHPAPAAKPALAAAGS